METRLLTVFFLIQCDLNLTRICICMVWRIEFFEAFSLLNWLFFLNLFFGHVLSLPIFLFLATGLFLRFLIPSVRAAHILFSPAPPSSSFPTPSLAGIYFKDLIWRDWYGSRNHDCSQWVGGARAEWGDTRGVKRYKRPSWFIPVSGTLRNDRDTDAENRYSPWVSFGSGLLKLFVSITFCQEGYKEKINL